LDELFIGRLIKDK